MLLGIREATGRFLHSARSCWRRAEAEVDVKISDRSGAQGWQYSFRSQAPGVARVASDAGLHIASDNPFGAGYADRAKVWQFRAMPRFDGLRSRYGSGSAPSPILRAAPDSLGCVFGTVHELDRLTIRSAPMPAFALPSPQRRDGTAGHTRNAPYQSRAGWVFLQSLLHSRACIQKARRIQIQKSVLCKSWQDSADR